MIPTGYSIALLLSLLSTFFTTPCAVVTLPEYNRSFLSLPAVFGRRFPAEDSVYAYLQAIDDWPPLCKQGGRTPVPEDVVTPDDGLPVALLVERGICTFWEKGQMALFWPAVQYVIVYDQTYKDELVPMSSNQNTKVGLVFVTRASGLRKSHGASWEGSASSPPPCKLTQTFFQTPIYGVHRTPFVDRTKQKCNDKWRSR
jgi:hypothetical protein